MAEEYMSVIGRVKKFIRKYRRLGRLAAVLGLVIVSYCAFTFLGNRRRVVQEPTPTRAFPLAVTAIPNPTSIPMPSLTSTPVPNPTSMPSPVAQIITDCIWSAVYVADITIPDGTVLEPNVRFTKTWRIENTGTCIWDDEVYLVFVSGEMSGADVPLLGVLPGEEVEVSISVIAPRTPGDYAEVWMVCRGDYYFGAVTIVVTVPEGTALVVPSATAVPLHPAPVCHCSRDGYDCSDFVTQAQAQACFDYCIEQGWGDIHCLDQDDDGIACEALP